MGRLRIIAGELRGRRIRVPDAPGVRPTPERVREALFAILAPRTAGARVLDAFAGSGVLGCEALSRGARSVVFIELDARVAAALRGNLGKLGISDRCRVVVADAVSGARAAAGSGEFDLVLADPPYRTELPQRFLDAVLRGGLLDDAGLLVLERSSKDPPSEVDAPWACLRSATYGDTRLEFYGNIGEG